MKRMVSVICAASLAITMTACGTTAQSEDYSNTTLTGKVTAMDGSMITIQLGELTEAESNMEAPQGDAGSGETPPEKPDGESDAQQSPEQAEDTDNQQEPPEKPDGESDAQQSSEQAEDADNQQEPPEKPEEDGETAGSMHMEFTEGDGTATIDLGDAQVTEESGGQSEERTRNDIEEGDIVVIAVGEDNTVQTVTIKNLGDMGGSFGGSDDIEQGSAANTIDNDGTYTDETYTSQGDDENALRVDGAEVNLTDITVNKSAGATSNTENGDFYGVNAGLLATNGAQVTITGATVTTDAQNGNGVFSYGETTVVNISDSSITTTKDNSGGIQTTGGGTTNASNLTVETAGNSSAAIRSDRGGGTVRVDGGSYTSNGVNSPAVYSTADITVKNAQLTANSSEALVVEGKNSITLEDCTVTGNMSDTEGASSDENIHNVMIYQSMSGDADVGTAAFSMTGGSLTAQNGDMFYITNTSCELSLSDVAITNEDSEANLLTVTGNSASHGWGSAGDNGAQVTFTADAQTLAGDIEVDTISTLDMTLSNGSSFTGTINIVDNEQDGTAVEDNAVVTIAEGCTWTLTGDCTITSLTNNGTINLNGYTITLADGTVMK